MKHIRPRAGEERRKNVKTTFKNEIGLLPNWTTISNLAKKFWIMRSFKIRIKNGDVNQEHYFKKFLFSGKSSIVSGVSISQFGKTTKNTSTKLKTKLELTFEPTQHKN